MYLKRHPFYVQRRPKIRSPRRRRIGELKDDPETKLYEPFAGCSADYVNGPGAALDRKNIIGPENSVMISPDEMKSMGWSEAEIQAQTQAWNKLSREEREEQLCRAAQQNAVIDEQR